MKNPLTKTPFLFFLIPLIVGILLQYYFKIEYMSIAFSLIGVIAMLFSYLVVEKQQFRWRWLFGAGLMLFLISVGIVSTSFSQQRSDFTFSNNVEVYEAVVADTPQKKPRSTAYKVYLPAQNKQVICYFQKGESDSPEMHPGDVFLFQGRIQPFRNMGDFDYARYMYNQGIAGSVYVSSQSWHVEDRTVFSLQYFALNIRQQIMSFYESLGFTETEYSILSALTLGYQNDLSDDIKQGFRTTGTVHVLSVSGLHVGIIYIMVSFLLGFIRRGTKYYWIKPLAIILLLWIYAFITGLPPSVIRASGMLTVFCLSEILGRNSFSLHALFIAGFFILLISPFSLFDIGFQLSFLSVLSILYLQPRASSLLKIDNKYLRQIWQLFTLSIVAQLATFPLCLYYFGTFPTYFFVTNLVIVPLVTLITYAVGTVILAKILSLIFPALSFYFYYLPVKILAVLVEVMTALIRFFENLPLALIENVKVSLLDLGLLFTLILGFLSFIIYKKSKGLILALLAVFLLLSIQIYNNIMFVS